MAVKQRVSIHKHGEVFFVGVHSFFASHPGTMDSPTSEVLESPTDEVLGGTVQRLLNRSGVLDSSLLSRGTPGRSHASVALGLPSDASCPARRSWWV